MVVVQAILLAFGLIVVLVIWNAREAGKRQLPASILARGRPLVQVTSTSPTPGWQGLGSMTTADGLDLRQAEEAAALKIPR